MGTYRGGTGNDSYAGTASADTAWGMAGNDNFATGDGNDVLYGGNATTGNDTMSGSGDDALNGNAGNDTLHGGDGSDSLLGGAGLDELRGGSGDDTLNGNAGNDALRGDNGGVDTGNDTYIFSVGLIGAPATYDYGTDTIYDVGGTADTFQFTVGITPNDLTDRAVTVNLSTFALTIQNTTGRVQFNGGTVQVENIISGNGADSLTGSAANNSFSGNGGNDTLIGGNGDDTLEGGAGTDRLTGDAGNDTFIFQNGWGSDSTLSDTAGNDVVDFSAVTNNLTIDLRFPRIYDGLNTIGWSRTATAIESIIGGTGNDTYRINSSLTAINISDAGGIDTMESYLANYTLGASLDNLTLVGYFSGFTGVNGTGNSLNNIITGNTVDNSMDGAGGNDTYVFLNDFAQDTISDSAGNDTLDFQALTTNVTIDLAAGSATNTRSISEFQVNTYTTSNQSAWANATLSNGNVVVSWVSQGQDGSGNGVYAQLYDSTANALGGEFSVNTTTAAHQGALLNIVTLTSGFVIVWESEQDSDSSVGIFGQRYDANGNTVGSEFEINTYTTDSQYESRIIQLTNGNYVCLWESWGQDGDGAGVYGQRFDASFNKLGGEFHVSTASASQQGRISATALTGGAFVVTWQSYGQDGSEDGVYAQRYDASGAKAGTEFRVNVTTANTQWFPAVTDISLGAKFVVAWEGYDTATPTNELIYIRVYNANGTAVTSEKVVDTIPDAGAGVTGTAAPVTVVETSTGFLVVWSAIGAPASSDPNGGIYGRRYDANGNALASEFHINTTTAGNQYLAAPIVQLSDGSFVLIYQSTDVSNTNGDIYGQRLAADGTLLGGEFGIHSYTSNEQFLPVVTALQGGGFLVSWTSSGQDGDGEGVYAQRFDASGNKVGSPYTATNTVTMTPNTIENAVGGSGNDAITGSTANNSLSGGVGNDTLDGGAGNDTLVGGTGNDTYNVDSSSDVVTENAGGGTDTVQASLDYTLGTNLENLTLLGGGNISGTGNTLDNSMVGNTGNNTLTGGGGNDQYNYTVSSTGTDTINDASGTADVLNLSSFTSSSFILTAVDSGDAGTNLDQLRLVGNSMDISIQAFFNNSGLTLASPTAAGTGLIESIYFSDVTVNGYTNIIALITQGENWTGTTGNDTKTSTAFNDTLNAIAGNDSVNGGDGNDLIYGGDDNDTLNGAAGNDTLHGEAGDDLLIGGTGNDSMVGGTGNDSYRVDSASDVVVEAAGAGTDVITQCDVSYTLTANVEHLYLNSGDINGTGNALDNTIGGTTGNNILTGNDGNDTLYGVQGNDSLDGGNGNDSIDGGFGADTLVGGVGDDTYILVQEATDVVTEGAGGGIDTVKTSFDYTLGANLENLTLVGGGNINGTGNTLDNSMVGNTGNNTLSGLGGNDTLDGGDGNDSLAGGNNDDSVSGGNNDDTLSGNSGNDTLDGGAGNDTLNGDYNDDVLQGGAGDDTYQFSAIANQNSTINDASGSNDTFNYASQFATSGLTWAAIDTADGDNNIDALTYFYTNGTNTVQGTIQNFFNNGGLTTLTSAAGTGFLENFVLSNGTFTGYANIMAALFPTPGENWTGDDTANTRTSTAGNDTLNSLGGNDSISGADGNDSILGGDGDDVLNGDNGNDTIAGEAGNDNLTGDNGNDSISGGDGNDTITGGDGNDTMDGGIGDNTFIFGGGNNFGNDSISAAGGLNDQIDLSAITVAANIDLGSAGLIKVSSVSNYISWSGTIIERAAGTQGNDTMAGSTGANYLEGKAGDDSIQGLGGDDTLTGGQGNDTVDGGLNNDQYVFEPSWGNDSLMDSGGNDTVYFGGLTTAVTINLNSTAGAEVTNGTDTINWSGDVIEIAYGGSSGDTMTSHATIINTLSGGVGNDTYVVSKATDVIYEFSGEGSDTVQSSVNYTLSSAQEIEHLTLTGTASTGTGNTLANAITGNASNNTLDGGTGNDTMVGGMGNDTYLVDSASDAVTENSGAGTDNVQTSVSYTLGDNVENLTLTGGALSGTGNILANVLTGNTGANTLDGGAGNDTMVGGSGDDTYLLDSASDVVTENAGGGTDTIQIGSNYTLAANVENLTLTSISALSGTGNTLNNILTGNIGANTLNGSTGNDTMAGGAGSDVYFVDAVGDVVDETTTGSAGTDTVNANTSYTLGTNLEHLVLTGTNDWSGTGNTAANSLTGNSGNNTLDGGTGNDTMDGGGGNDSYYVNAAGDVVDETITGSGGTDTVYAGLSYTLGTNLENLTLLDTGSNNFNGTGNTGNNLIIGNSGNNSLDGGMGNDTIRLYDGFGIDSIVGGSGTDTIDASNLSSGITIDLAGGTGSSTQGTLASIMQIESVIGSNQADSLTGTSGADTISAGTGNDTVKGGQGNDSLLGGDGNDTFTFSGFWGTDTVNGGLGLDTVDFSGTSVPMTINLSTGTVSSTDGAITAGNLVAVEGVIGSVSNDSITGSAGDDTLIGYIGNDTLIGGAGNDTYRYAVDHHGTDSITDASGTADVLDLSYMIRAGFSITATDSGDAGSNLDGLRIWGNSIEILINNFFSNTSTSIGTSTAGTGFIESIIFQDFTSTSPYDLFPGVPTPGNDNIIGTNGNDIIDALAGNDTVRGLLGDDSLIGNTGNDILNGEGGDDTLVGGDGNDTLNGDDGNDTYKFANNWGNDVILVESSGTDTLDFSAVTTNTYINLNNGSSYSTPVGANEVLVNQSTATDQISPDIAFLTDGRYVVTWQHDSGSQDIYAQIYNADGTIAKSQFRVNATTADGQTSPSIVALSDGEFLVTWTSKNDPGTTTSHDIFVQQFNADGTTTGHSEARLNTTITSATQANSRSASASDGRYVVMWNSQSTDSGPYDAYAALFNADGTQVDLNGGTTGKDMRVNSTTAGDQYRANAAFLTDGGFVITWDSSGQDGSGTGVYAKIYNTDGSVRINEFLINDQTANAQQAPSITALLDGGFVVTWQSNNQDNATSWGIYAQILNADGSERAGEFRVNTPVLNDQEAPEITTLADGGFVITWQSNNQDNGTSWGIYARIFNADGSERVGEFLVNTTTLQEQKYPSISATDNGFIITWQSYHDDSDYDIYTQRFDANGNKIGAATGTITLPANTIENVIGGSGNDNITGNALNNTLSGADGNDTLTGADGDDTLTGGNGADSLSGGNGQDTLVGDAGNDSLNGGAGNDTYQFSNNWGTDTITADSSGTDLLNFSTVTGNLNLNLTSGNAVLVTTGANEFRVNSYTTDNQRNASVTALSDGGFVITWESNLQDGSDYGVYGQRYDSTGNRVTTYDAATGILTSEFRINSYTTIYQGHSSVLALSDGGFLVTWHSNGQDGSNNGVYGQRYDSSGNRVTTYDATTGTLTNEFRINSYTTDSQAAPSVTALSDGGFVITWESEPGQDGSSAGVYGQRYDSSGNRVTTYNATTGTLTNEFRINSYTTSGQGHSSVIGLSDGGFVVTWDSSGQDGSTYGVYGQRYDSSGNRVTTYDATTGTMTNEFRINSYTINGQMDPSVTALTGGGFMVTWESETGQDGDGKGVYGQRYDSSGNRVTTYDAATGTMTNEFRINSYTTSNQQNPSVTALSDGGFMVTWDSYGPDGGGDGVYGQRYDSTGNRVTTYDVATGTMTNEFRINSQTLYAQHGSSVRALADGGFVVTWSSSDGQDGSGYGVYAQRYNSNGNIVGPATSTITMPDNTIENVIGGSGNDSITGNTLANSLDGSTGNDTLSGADGNDTLLGNAGTDSLTGGNGNDSLDGGTGNDTMAGGAGDDTYILDSASDSVSENASEGTDTVQISASYTLTANVENLTLGGSGDINGTGNSVANVIMGTTGNNTLTGNDGNDTLNGGDGADSLDGGAGTDSLVGGEGGDTYVIDSGDTINETGTTGRDLVRANFNYTLGSTLEDLTLTAGSLSGTGNAQANVITANSGTNALVGLGGNDTLNGGTGIDSLTGGIGDDSLLGGGGNDTYLYTGGGALGTDIINDASGTDTLNLTVYAKAAFTFSTVDTDSDGNINDLILTNSGAGTKITIKDYFADDATMGASSSAGTGRIETIQFADGVFDPNTDLSDGVSYNGDGNPNTFNGGAGNDTLSGSGGNDTLNGGDGNDLINGGDDNDSLDGGGGNDTINGEAGNDTLIGGTGNDSITGGTGTDSITGGDGADILYGGDGNDTIDGGAGNDTIYGEAGNDSLSGGNDNDLMYGGANDDTLDGGAGNDTLYGEAGNDSLIGGIGDDSMIGGIGDDIYVVDSASDTVVESSSEGTDTVQASIDYTLGSNLENLTLTGSSNLSGTGNTLDNSITGNSGNNTLTGGDGNDTLDGSTGNDSMTGGIGNDVYVVDSASDTVVESSSEGTDTVQASIDYTLGSNLENLTLTGSGNLSGTGNSENNTLVGNTGNNTLMGDTGNDTLTGGTGNDSLLGGNGNDTYLYTGGGALGTDIINDSAGVADVLNLSAYTLASLTFTAVDSDDAFTEIDTLIITGAGLKITIENFFDNSGADPENSAAGSGFIESIIIGGTTYSGYTTIIETLFSTSDTATEGDDLLDGDPGGIPNPDTLDGLGGNDTINGYFMNDTLTGGTGNDEIDAGANDDVLMFGINFGNDTVIGGLGNDTLNFSGNNAAVTANITTGTATDGTNTVTITSGIESLVGTSLADSLTGNSSSNTLTGGGGNDTMNGGSSNDTFVLADGFAAATNGDTLDGGSGVGDILDVSALTAGVTFNMLIAGGDADGYANVTLNGAAANFKNIESVIATGLADSINGDAVANTLIGGGGNDTLDGGNGNDRLEGGTGNDTLSGGSGTSSGNDTILGDAGDDSISGIDGNDSLSGGDGNDTILGGNGNDTLVAGLGADSLTGEAGDDTFVLQTGYGLISIDGGLGADTVDFSALTSAMTLNLTAGSLASSGSTTISSGLAITAESFLLSAFNDTGVGDSGINTIKGGAGDDAISGNDGNDRLEGGTGNDTIEGGNGNDTIFGEDGTNSLTGGAGNDAITGGSGTDSIEGGAGNDTLKGGNGTDVFNMTSGFGNDVINGGDGNDTLNFSTITAAMTVNLSSGTATDGTSTIVTGNILLIETVLAGSGADTITGDSQANSLSGNDGNDTLSGGMGSDTLLGGSGNDRYKSFTGNFGTDIINDASGSADVLDLSNYATTGLTWTAIDTNSDTFVDALKIASGLNSMTILNYFSNTTTDDDTSTAGTGAIESIIASDDADITFADILVLVG